MQVRTCYFSETTNKRLVLEDDEIIISISIPKQLREEKYLFYKLTQNNSSGLGILNIAVIGKKDKDENICKLSLYLGGIFAKPRCFENLNDIVIGKKTSEEIFKLYANEISKIIEEESKTLIDYEYKRNVVPNVILDVLKDIFLNISIEDN